MKIAYFDCFSGISGDMCLGALISAGVDFRQLKGELANLPVGGYDLHWEKVERNGITAVNVFVDLLDIHQPQRNLNDILEIIDKSTLPGKVKENSKTVFNRLAVAEATVHDTTIEQIHFHEVGAVDAIVDVVGTVLGLHFLGVEKIYASPLPMGTGFIKCTHGLIPSPAPATLEVLRDVPIYGSGVEGELVTPTGASLISVMADAFINLPPMIARKVGYGSGKKVNPEHPNLLRLIIGESCETNIIGLAACQSGTDHKHHHPHPHPHEHDHAHGDGHSREHGHSHGHDHENNHDKEHGHTHEKG